MEPRSKLAAEPEAPTASRTPVLTTAFPSAGQTVFTLTLPREQAVRVAVFDVQGREIAFLYDGTLAGRMPHTFRLGASQWPAGFYFVRATGFSFALSQPVLFVQ